MVKATKEPVSTKKPVKKITKKNVTKRKRVVATVSDKVDYYPNRMTVAISALAGTLIVLFALIAVLGSQ
ncbi:hypothetical protein H7Y29_00815 [Microbacteriaceae bacterium]|nr:hypothetical protein [Candidatus Saccharibacteria bacterium]